MGIARRKAWTDEGSGYHRKFWIIHIMLEISYEVFKERERKGGGKEGGRGGLAAWNDCSMKTQRKNKA